VRALTLSSLLSVLTSHSMSQLNAQMKIWGLRVYKKSDTLTIYCNGINLVTQPPPVGQSEDFETRTEYKHSSESDDATPHCNIDGPDTDFDGHIDLPPYVNPIGLLQYLPAGQQKDGFCMTGDEESEIRSLADFFYVGKAYPEAFELYYLVLCNLKSSLKLKMPDPRLIGAIIDCVRSSSTPTQDDITFQLLQYCFEWQFKNDAERTPALSILLSYFVEKCLSINCAESELNAAHVLQMAVEAEWELSHESVHTIYREVIAMAMRLENNEKDSSIRIGYKSQLHEAYQHLKEQHLNAGFVERMIDWSARVIMENRAELDEAFPTENILSHGYNERSTVALYSLLWEAWHRRSHFPFARPQDIPCLVEEHSLVCEILLSVTAIILDSNHHFDIRRDNMGNIVPLESTLAHTALLGVTHLKEHPAYRYERFFHAFSTTVTTMAYSNPALTREVGGLLRKSADAIRKVCGSSSQNLQTPITTQCIGSEQQVPSICLERLGGGWIFSRDDSYDKRPASQGYSTFLYNASNNSSLNSMRSLVFRIKDKTGASLVSVASYNSSNAMSDRSSFNHTTRLLSFPLDSMDTT